MHNSPRGLCFGLVWLLAGLLPGLMHRCDAQEFPLADLQQQYAGQVRPLVVKYCQDCHATAVREGELDLEQFGDMAAVRKSPATWQKVAEQLDHHEMPPKDAAQPEPGERILLRTWVQKYLDAEARASAGDPGPVVLRRLSNAEYTYTIQDLTGTLLEPAREFPADSAAGEGFTNTGSALVMSPAMVTKYLDAARDIASHAVLLPRGHRFSPYNTRNDWTNDALHRIRQFYGRYTENSTGESVNLQGIVFDTNGGGRLPLTACLKALLQARNDLQAGRTTIEAVADQHQLSSTYLTRLWNMLNVDPAERSTNSKTDERPVSETVPGSSVLFDELRRSWRQAKADDAESLAAEIAVWQQALWRFTTVGHIGKLNGPKAWMEPVSPLAESHEIRLALPQSAAGGEITLYLAAGDAGDGNQHDVAVWRRPRLVAPGRPDLLLRDLRSVLQRVSAHRESLFSSAAKCLDAAASVRGQEQPVDVSTLAGTYGVTPESLEAWLGYLGIGVSGQVRLGTPITGSLQSLSGYDFIRAWAGDDALSVVANSSDEHVRIPGNMKPHSIAVHPAPTRTVAVGWRSPVSAALQIQGSVQHAHPECGNGVAWSLELRRGNTKQRIADGVSRGAAVVPIPSESPATLSVLPGDVICLIISPVAGNHSCDLTAIDLKLQSADETWDLAGELSPDLLAGNPHADGRGRPDVWHFFSEPTSGDSGAVIPADSLLAKWQAESRPEELSRLASDLQNLLLKGVDDLPQDAPNAVLYHQLNSLTGPLLSKVLSTAAESDSGAAPADSDVEPGKPDTPGGTPGNRSGMPVAGLDSRLFGKDPLGGEVAPEDLCLLAPSVLEVRLPADLLVGAEFVTTASLHPKTGQEGSVQMQVLTTEPGEFSGLQPASATTTRTAGPWTSSSRGIAFAAPVIVSANSSARARFETMFDEHRQLFPAALCYTKIVPVDEVVTLTLFYREDDHLQRLMLSEDQKRELDELWDELHYVSRDALTLVDAYEQLMEYATQDADPGVFEPMRGPINERANAFRQLLVSSESSHVESALEFAEQAFRRPLTDTETQQLRSLYTELRGLDLSHEEAVRLLIARVLVSPAFLYRIEVPGSQSAPVDVSDHELASRLSYFLWSSQPDAALREVAAAGRLHDPEVLREQLQRMLRDPKIRRLSTEFACQWLHVYDFDQLDEKSDRHFPEFAAVRESMYEEVIQYFTHLFQQDGSILEVFDSNHVYVNDVLAQHYGIPNISGSEWRQVSGARQYSRGGIVTMAATLSKQSGASRTSPILRGNWLSEVILGEKLPKPPKGVPPLPDEASSEMLSVRKMVERHTQDVKCSGCHLRIDPYGFALESFDAIGRFRTEESAGLPVDTHTIVQDGTVLQDSASLRQYLTGPRRNAVVRQFCRKLLGYSLGRSVQLSDEPLLTRMQSRLEHSGYRISVAVEEIVLSPQFRQIRGQQSIAVNP